MITHQGHTQDGYAESENDKYELPATWIFIVIGRCDSIPLLGHCTPNIL